eukprot:CAMPEP_0118869688 /NCGR_PEP_ID=MMETSP1163-20130328/12938_1 /TAXON_ID=124430 /ORGANISM="Phaeomonas parva, Strain CCMP2877" /LENGTH=93 /DNA_ID=CAMNT_0006804609 /DNA_START=154 /DNA_END=435 /DNA_ORIENTATION=-
MRLRGGWLHPHRCVVLSLDLCLSLVALVLSMGRLAVALLAAVRVGLVEAHEVMRLWAGACLVNGRGVHGRLRLGAHIPSPRTLQSSVLPPAMV